MKILIINLYISLKLFYNILLIIENTFNTNNFLVSELVYNLVNIITNFINLIII